MEDLHGEAQLKTGWTWTNTQGGEVGGEVINAGHYHTPSRSPVAYW